MRTSATRAVVFLAVAAVTAGCQSFEQRFVGIESRQAAIEAQLADLQAQQQTLIARQVQLRQELDNALQPLRTQSADRGEDLRSMQREVTALEERIAEVDDRIGRLSEQLAAGGVSRPGDRPPTGQAMPPPRGTTGTPQSVQPQTPADSEATTLYNSAFNDYLRQSYDLCIQGFEEYIRRYPSSDRADDARYWIGECHASRGDNASARNAFRDLIRDYPSSDRIPDAMFRDAFILKDEGQTGAAVEAFRRLIQAYGQSDAAYLACGQLTSLGAERPASCGERN